MGNLQLSDATATLLSTSCCILVISIALIAGGKSPAGDLGPLKTASKGGSKFKNIKIKLSPPNFMGINPHSV